MIEPLDLLPSHKHGLRLASPVMAAAGAFGYAGPEARAIIPPGLGAIVTRTLTLRPRRPAPVPRFVETLAGLVHRLHVGNVGFGKALRQCHWASSTAPVIVSITGTPADCAYMADRLDETPGVAGIELSLWELSTDEIVDVVEVVREATSLPILAKLSPVPVGPDLVPLVCACVDVGADVLVIGGPWPALAPADAQRGEPLDGWLSGPALLPLVLPRVRQVAQAVTAPVIGCGGIHSSADVRAYLQAGAQAVQVGSAFLVDPLIRFTT